jgi:pimeloyl-ACP methyl ester carboxylesterase
MNTVVSRDGTRIAFDRVGNGSPVILVDGALCHRAFGPSKAMARELSPKFSVITYDRRGRGESGNTRPYAVEREYEDIEALITAAGGSAGLVGFSSGAALALAAVHHGAPARKVAVYEPPFIVDAGRDPIPTDFRARLDAAIAAGRPGDAVRMFMKLVGAPSIMVTVMRLTPAWRKLKAVAHTLPYDIELVEQYQRGTALPPARWSGVRVPALVLAGGKSPAWMRNAAKALADALPRAEHRVLAGQTHMVKPGVLAPGLVDFFAEA